MKNELFKKINVHYFSNFRPKTIDTMLSTFEVFFYKGEKKYFESKQHFVTEALSIENGEACHTMVKDVTWEATEMGSLDYIINDALSFSREELNITEIGVSMDISNYTSILWLKYPNPSIESYLLENEETYFLIEKNILD